MLDLSLLIDKIQAQNRHWGFSAFLLTAFLSLLFLLNFSIELFQKLDPSAVPMAAKASFEEAFLGLQKLLAAVKDIREGIGR